MKITDIRCVPVVCPRKRAFGGVTTTALGPAAFSDYTIVFVETDAGITGLGEVDSVFKRRGALLHHDLQKGLVPAVIGEDPFRIASIVRKMDQVLDGVEEGKAGIEMALWDIVGKALDTPVYNLLGGKVRERIPLSYSIPFGSPDQMAELARERGEVGSSHHQGEDRKRGLGPRHRGGEIDPQGDRPGREASRRRQHGMADRQAGDRGHPRDRSGESRTGRAAARRPTISTAWRRYVAASAFR